MTGNTLVTVTFILLCHDSAERVITLVRQLLEEDPDCRVIVHLDKKSPKNTFRKLVSALDDEPHCHLMQNRVRCGWGQWGLVEAPLRALRYALSQPIVTDYFYLISEYCRPVRPLRELRKYLTKYNGIDFIDCKGPEWIKGGIREDRYLYRHYLDKRKHPKLHRWMYRTQKHLRLKRQEPKTFKVSFGSQWWALRKETVEVLFDTIFENQEYKRLKSSWVPDECFFQTIVGTVADCKIRGTLTYSFFDENGRASFFQGGEGNDVEYFFFRKKI